MFPCSRTSRDVDLFFTMAAHSLARESDLHVFVELGGNALGYSLNLETTVPSSRVLVRIGVAYYFSFRKHTAWIFPVTMGVRLRSRSPYIEIGGGILGIYEPGYGHFHSWGTLIFGLRWQSSRHPFVFRVVLTPLIMWTGTVFNDGGNFIPVPWAGVSFGIRF